MKFMTYRVYRQFKKSGLIKSGSYLKWAFAIPIEIAFEAFVWKVFSIDLNRWNWRKFRHDF